MEKKSISSSFSKKIENFIIFRARNFSHHTSHTKEKKGARALSNNEKKKAYFISAKNHALAQKKEREIEMNEE